MTDMPKDCVVDADGKGSNNVGAGLGIQAIDHAAVSSLPTPPISSSTMGGFEQPSVQRMAIDADVSRKIGDAFRRGYEAGYADAVADRPS